MEQDNQRMRELIATLDMASKAYYQEDKELMSNFEYDKLYDELVDLEKKMGVTLSGSPTVQVGYEALTELPKERHEQPMLSLGKTKDREEIRDWLKDQEALLSWKLDGLTIVLTYREGKLFKAVTRGNGEIGEVITNNAKVFQNIPHTIPYQGELILRGEAVISYQEFERINLQISDVDAKYKNPRNLCSGSVRQLNNEITAKRNVNFFAFALVKAEGLDFKNSREQQFIWLKQQGFDVVGYKRVRKDTILASIQEFEDKITANEFPSDGLVLLLDDISYGDSLGRTAKSPRNAIAFKWQDEIKETRLLEIEWSASRTGLINPVAIFEPVELEGTTVSRASVHNLSIMKNLELGIGDTIEVYKANMIIPQIAENRTRSGKITIPESCPVCHEATQIKKMNDVESLYCTNPDCEAKKIKSFSLFVSRDAMNIEGISESTLEKFIGKGYIKEFADIYHLDTYQEEIKAMEGMGEKSYANLVESIEKSRKTTLPKLLYSLGILNIGLSNAKMICKELDYSSDRILECTAEELSTIEGVGDVIAANFVDYFNNPIHRENYLHLLKEVQLESIKQEEEEQTLKGKTFVITGSVEHFENRNALKEFIESKGGKATGSVTTKTDYLINNDVESNSSKNKKAKELGIPILSEDDLIALTEQQK
ncbi:MAG: NAD-dependent DNA ligase LigA [Lachnospiraceae bacterium]|nr:NAD-dependent DNA ligase LigA [Lachnospiraceae bacterium]